MTDIPHFDLPFRYNGPNVVEAEQDSIEDIVNCVEAILLTQIGERIEVPGFGINMPTFEQQPIDLAEMITQVSTYEPRADVVMDQHPSIFDRLVANVDANVSKKET